MHRLVRDEGAQPGSLAPELLLYTKSYLIRGHVDPGLRRLSDYLNDPRAAYLVVQQATCYDLLAEEAAPATRERVAIRRETVRLAVPQDAPSGPGARVPTQQVPLYVGIGLLTVRGSVHRRRSDPTDLRRALQRVQPPVRGGDPRDHPLRAE